MSLKNLFAAVLLFMLFFSSAFAQSAGVSINETGTAPDASAILDISSQDRGVLFPRMTESERLAMPNVTQGLVVYQTDAVQGFWVYNGSQWAQFPTVGQQAGDIQYWDGTQWLMVPPGSTGQVLMLSDTGLPVWAGLEPVVPGYGVLASVVTDSVYSIYASGAQVDARVLASGGTQVTDYGVCYSTSPAPTINDQFTWEGTTGQGNTAFSSALTGLAGSTTYYVRAYAINAAGVSYGTELTFTTASGQVQITTKSASQTGATFIVSGGMITDYAGASVTGFGICWSTDPQPDIDSDDFLSTPGDAGNFDSHIIGLDPGTTYYVRAYATTDGFGTFYGDDVQVTTNAVLVPAVGETYGGGIVFYVDQSGEHGLILALGDYGSSSWGCNSSTVGASGTAIGTGQANTTAIVNGCAQSGIPARVCDDLVHEGFSDWYLPSRDELIQLYGTMYLFLHWNAGSNSAWSSSEGACGPSFGGACSAYYHYCNQPACGSFANKNSVIRIRPVRNF
jgi:hypothetical protein